MTTTVAGSDLHVDVAMWSGFQVPRSEVIATLTFLAHKLGKPVRLSQYRETVQYSAGVINIYIATNATCTDPRPVSPAPPTPACVDTPRADPDP